MERLIPMTNERQPRPNRAGKVKKAQAFTAQASIVSDPIRIEAGHAGDWLPADDLRLVALEASREAKNVVLNLEGLNHLDASALQVLLALNSEQKDRGLNLSLMNASEGLMRWFEYSGGAGTLSINRENGDE